MSHTYTYVYIVCVIRSVFSERVDCTSTSLSAIHKCVSGNSSRVRCNILWALNCTQPHWKCTQPLHIECISTFEKRMHTLTNEQPQPHMDVYTYMYTRLDDYMYCFSNVLICIRTMESELKIHSSRIIVFYKYVCKYNTCIVLLFFRNQGIHIHMYLS